MLRILTETETDVTQLPYPFVKKDFVAIHYGNMVHLIIGEKHKLVSLDDFDSAILDDDLALDEFFD